MHQAGGMSNRPSGGPTGTLRSGSEARLHPGFHIMAKPIGPLCNLHCTYCFYLEKEHLYPKDEQFRMSEKVLQAYVHQYIDAQPGPDIFFTWQGGEPTLMGLPFFRKVVELQRKYVPAGKRIHNALQTNATLLDKEWATFLREEGFLVGVSLDGPPALHDACRLDKMGRPTGERVLQGLRLLQEHGVDVNVLCVVNRINGDHPLEVYRFFRELGVEHIQFIPLVEPAGAEPVAYEAALRGEGVSERSVLPEQFGRFLTTIFDHWVRHDVGKVFVQIFEEAVSVALGMGASLCIFQETCGRALAMEHNGDLFSCDHFVNPAHFLGNICDVPLATLVASPRQEAFGRAKADRLPDYCRACPVWRYCHGECPRNRIIRSPENEEDLNYLCAGYRSLFQHIRPRVEEMARLLQAGVPAWLVSERILMADEERFARAGRNDPCPCGSGKKYKRCCLPQREAASRRSDQRG